MEHPLLSGPILPRLVRLTMPILVVLLVQTLVGVAETYFVSGLGTAALAGVSLVFPVLMLMTMMSNGAFGGGVASAVARAVGAGRMDEADALVLHTAVIALAFGLLFSLAIVLGGPSLYAFLGARGSVLTNALLYSNLVFGASALVWTTNLFAAALRGAGDVKVPALLTLLGAVLTLALSPLLIFGAGPVAGLGLAGAGVAVIVYYSLATAALIAYLRSKRSPVRLVLAPLRWARFRDILGVGLMSAVGTLTANVTVMVAVGFVGAYGADAIAGYGVASRLDYLLVPLLFAVGTACVTMVGMNVGAGQWPRARRVAWTAVAVSGAGTALVGVVAVLLPAAWTGLFSHETAVTSVGNDYLRTVAPVYAAYGVGMAIYFASQGAGTVAWPLFASVVRLALVLAGGWMWSSWHGGGLDGLFLILAASYVVYGAINLAAFASPAWGRPIGRNPRADAPASIQPTALGAKP